jgi:hypothetical protein
LVTKPVTFAGKTLELNYRTAGEGRVGVEIQDADGRPIEGFSADRCRPLQGDELAAALGWDGADVGSMAAKAVRLRFVVRDAEVYSWRFVP